MAYCCYYWHTAANIGILLLLLANCCYYWPAVATISLLLLILVYCYYYWPTTATTGLLLLLLATATTMSMLLLSVGMESCPLNFVTHDKTLTLY